jgi:hypothetical protein
VWDKKTRFLKNEPRKLLITNGKTTLIAKNEPENEAGKLLKIRSCGKNEPKTNQREFGLDVAATEPCPPRLVESALV